MDSLINIQQIQINNNSVHAISARELHNFLDSKRIFTDWVKQYITDNNDYGFMQGIDFTRIHAGVNPTNGVLIADYAFTINMAKEVSMLSKTLKGKQARKYFIECEQKLNQSLLPDFTNPAIAARAWADEIEAKLKLQNKLATSMPLINFAETVARANNGILVRELAYLVQNEHNIQLGEKRLWDWLRDNGYIHKTSTKPMQIALEKGLFMVQEYAINHTHGIETHFTTKVTGKGQLYFINKLKSQFNQQIH